LLLHDGDPSTNYRLLAAGVFGIGLAAYWPQFPGLKERLAGYQREVEQRLTALGAEVISAGLVDDAATARAAGDRFARAGATLLVCYVGTYAASFAGAAGGAVA